MADDTIEVILPFQNRSSDPPASSTGYDFKVLSQNQQRKLNELKVRTLRENHLYLNAHPEITALVTMLLTALYKYKPRNVRDFLAAYTKRPRLQLAVEALVEKQQQQLSEEKRSVERETSKVARPPLSLANIVFPSSLKVEDYLVELQQEVVTEAIMIVEDIMREILKEVDEKITQIEDYKMARSILGDVVTDFKPTMYPPCEPKAYTHTLSQQERQAKEPTYVVEGIKDDIITQVDENLSQIEDTEFIKELINSILLKSISTEDRGVMVSMQKLFRK